MIQSRLWFSYDPEGDGFVLHENSQEARKEAEAALAAYRDFSTEDGWGENMEDICWGKLHLFERAVQVDKRDDPSGRWDYLCDYALSVTNVTGDVP